MFRRLLWLGIGVGFGFGAAWWVSKFFKELSDRYSPERVAGSVADSLTSSFRGLGSDLKLAASEGRDAMRERETELRSELRR